jgi:hypothetical protein
MSLYAPGIGVVSGTDPVTVDILKFTGHVTVSHSDDMMVVNIDTQMFPTFDLDAYDNGPVYITQHGYGSGTVLSREPTLIKLGNLPFYDGLQWCLPITSTYSSSAPTIGYGIVRDDLFIEKNPIGLPTIEQFRFFSSHSITNAVTDTPSLFLSDTSPAFVSGWHGQLNICVLTATSNYFSGSIYDNGGGPVRSPHNFSWQTNLEWFSLGEMMTNLCNFNYQHSASFNTQVVSVPSPFTASFFDRVGFMDVNRPVIAATPYVYPGPEVQENGPPPYPQGFYFSREDLNLYAIVSGAYGFDKQFISAINSNAWTAKSLSININGFGVITFSDTITSVTSTTSLMEQELFVAEAQDHWMGLLVTASYTGSGPTNPNLRSAFAKSAVSQTFATTWSVNTSSFGLNAWMSSSLSSSLDYAFWDEVTYQSNNVIEDNRIRHLGIYTASFVPGSGAIIPPSGNMVANLYVDASGNTIDGLGNVWTPVAGTPSTIPFTSYSSGGIGSWEGSVIRYHASSPVDLPYWSYTSSLMPYGDYQVTIVFMLNTADYMGSAWPADNHILLNSSYSKLQATYGLYFNTNHPPTAIFPTFGLGQIMTVPTTGTMNVPHVVTIGNSGSTGYYKVDRLTTVTTASAGGRPGPVIDIGFDTGTLGRMQGRFYQVWMSADAYSEADVAARHSATLAFFGI